MKTHPYTIFAGLSSFEILATFRRGLFYTYLSIYLRHYLGLSITETSLFATLPMTASVIGQTLIWGRLSDRLQLRRSLIVAGEVLGGIGTLLVWYLHTLAAGPRQAGYVIIIGLAAVELFWSMSNISWSALISDIYSEEHRASIQGRLVSLGALGRIAGVWIGGSLYDGYGRHYPGWGFAEGALFFVAVGMMFASTLPMFLVPEGGVRGRSAATPTPAEGPAWASAGIFVLFLVGMLFVNFGRNSVNVMYAQYLSLESGFALSSRAVGYVANTRSLAVLLTGILLGWSGRRAVNGRRLLAGIAVAITSLLLFAGAKTMTMVYVSAALEGCSQTMIMVAGYALVSVLIPPGKRGRLFGIYNATIFLSWGLGGTLLAAPLADGLLAGGMGEAFSYRMAFVAAAVLTLIGFILQVRLAMVLARRRKQADSR